MRDRFRLRQSLELLYLLVRKELKIRYKNSVLGYFWALANPFAFAFVYWVAFKFIMRIEMENYSVFLLTGMFPWLWLSAGVVQATRSFPNNSSLVKKVLLPRAILPLSNVAHEMVHFLLAVPVFIVFLHFVSGMAAHVAWIWQIPFMVLVQLSFVYPLALLFALANVYVHDVEHLIGIAFSLLFFATPMVYPVSMVPPQYRFYFEANPFHALIDGWRSVLMQGELGIHQVLYALGFSLAVGVIAFVAYRRFAPKIAELL